MGFITDRAPPPSPLALHHISNNNNASDENSPPAHRKPPLPPSLHPSPVDYEYPHEHLNNNNPSTAPAVGQEINTAKTDEEGKVTFFPTPHNTNLPPINRTFPSSSASPWNPSPPAIKSGGGSQTFSLTTVPSFSSWIVEGAPLRPLDPQQQQQFQQPLGPPQVSDVIANIITGINPVHHGNNGDDDDVPMSPLDKLIVEIDCEEGFPATAIDFDDEYDEQQREQEEAVGMKGLVMGGREQQQQQQQSQRGMTTRSAASRQRQR